MTPKERNAILEAAILRIQAHVNDHDLTDRKARAAVEAIARKAYRIAIRDHREKPGRRAA